MQPDASESRSSVRSHLRTPQAPFYVFYAKKKSRFPDIQDNLVRSQHLPQIAVNIP
ncbi:hypothetical protein [Myxacorys almedinensis]|uniref:Uncharacterized protein n=1 Tax=Myxacorys almedinensis A TaxID=2690445 RepID=A0A8J7Z6D7_9CYAN|nr:hypothetical protein [Myxacorys almedinensis]NDJ16320.1 hypothetical protein [Myxacorys almedinensis A]